MQWGCEIKILRLFLSWGWANDRNKVVAEGNCQLVTVLLLPHWTRSLPLFVHYKSNADTLFVDPTHLKHVLLWHALHKGCSSTGNICSLKPSYPFWEEIPFVSPICRTAGTFGLQDHVNRRGKARAKWYPHGWGTALWKRLWWFWGSASQSISQQQRTSALASKKGQLHPGLYLQEHSQ